MGIPTTYTVSTNDSELKFFSLNVATSTKKINFHSYVFNYLFSSDDSLIEKNKKFILHLKRLIDENDKSALNDILSQDALKDLHPSLLKSALIITEKTPGINEAYQNLNNIYLAKMNCI